MFIRTVLGDITPIDLGVTYMHEHLIIDSEIVAKEMPHIYLPDVAPAVIEAKECKAAGVGTLVDCMPTDSGRNLEKLAEISRQAQINIIAVTGLHHQRYYDSNRSIERMNEDELANIFISEIESAPIRCGLIKIVTGGETISNRENRLIRAAVAASKATGVSILSHCEHGLGALQQIQLLKSLQMDLSRVVLSHTDKVKDFDYHREILNTGINVEYDQSLRELNDKDSFSAKLTAQMVLDGYENQIMLGTDGARRSLWRSLGGDPGLAALISRWPNRLTALGVTQNQLHKFFVINPARFLAIKH